MDWSARWSACWRSLGAPPPRGVLSDLLARYREPHRAYHTVQHLEECFAALDRFGADCERAAEVELGLWFHDAIYDPKRSDNEPLSAEWAERSARDAGLVRGVAERVRDLVLATRHDGEPQGLEARLLVDVDLCILGAEPERFAEYERQVRVEYAFVPEAGFRSGRSRVLRSFLDRAAIFGTPRVHAERERAARENLTRSLAELER
jgi:predicted metal-dependent HD superfamily phosphohydrolase